MAAIQSVRATGDTSGAADYQNIARAIAAVSPINGTVVLEGGTYYINTPITIGSITSGSATGCSLVGCGKSVLTFTGNTTTGYMISVFGDGNTTMGPRLSCLTLSCASKCRGILFHRQTYRCSIENVRIVTPYQVGLDVVSSWGATLKNIYVYYALGVATRVWRSQNVTFDSLAVRTSQASDWPATDDTTVKDDQDANVVTPAAARSCIHINSNNVTFRNLLLEANAMSALPLIYFNQNCSGVSFTEHMYLEGNTCTSEAVRINGPAANTSVTAHFMFENVLCENVAGDAFIRLTGYTSGVSVNKIRSVYQDRLNSVITADGGVHYGITCTSSRVGLVAASQIAAINSATINAAEPYSLNHTLVET